MPTPKITANGLTLTKKYFHQIYLFIIFYALLNWIHSFVAKLHKFKFKIANILLIFEFKNHVFIYALILSLGSCLYRRFKQHVILK
jgi:hypothetical protein